MEAREWLQRDLAFILGCKEQALNPILSGKRGVSPEMAKSLGKAFDVPADFFLNLQKAYELSQALEPSPDVAIRAKLQGTYPVREMIKRGWIEDSDAEIIESQLTQFFGVTDSASIPYLAHAAKKTRYEDKEIPPAQLAWLFRVKQIAKAISVPAFSTKKLQAAVSQLLPLLYSPDEARHVPKVLNDAGVRLIFVEKLPQANIDGVCFWLDHLSPVIGMSLRFDRIDNFWFVLRHEIEHILRGDGKSSEIFDSLEGETASPESSSLSIEELEANRAAANFCAPAEKLDSFMLRKKPYYYEKDVLALSQTLLRHPGLVVGQMQHKLKDYAYLKKHLIKIRGFILPGSIADGWGQKIPLNF